MLHPLHAYVLVVLLALYPSVIYSFSASLGQIKLVHLDSQYHNAIKRLASTTESAPLPWKSTVEIKTARDMADFKNKVPFSEGMYLTIKSTIEALSKRMNDGQPLSKSETEALAKNIVDIMADAKLHGPPEKPVRVDVEPPKYIKKP